MLSGSPSRGTELTAMLLCNTETRSTRNLVFLGRHLSLLCQYNKTSALTGREKLIPHGLDAVTSDVLVQDLVIAHPFAQIAAQLCFQDPAVDRLYQDHLFVNFDRLFTTDDLSSVMSKYSEPRVHFPLTVNPWRHIQTTWKRKFRCSAEDLMEKNAEDDVDALQAGHSRATENRIYGLSTQSLASVAEDVLPLFLQASSTWQRRCRTTPGGSCQPYTQARSCDLPEEDLSGQPAPSFTLSQSATDQIVDALILRLAPMLERASAELF